MKIFCFSLFNFTVPFVSFLAILLIMVIAFVMYLIPFHYICMIWGMSIMYLYNFNVNNMRCIHFLILSSSLSFTAVNKFGKNIYRPNRIRNSEVMDLLSRVPDDETLVCIHLILLYSIYN